MLRKECEHCGSSNALLNQTCAECETPFSPMWECQWCYKWNSFKNPDCMSCGVPITDEHPEDSKYPPGPVVVGQDLSQPQGEPKTDMSHNLEKVNRQELFSQLQGAIQENKIALEDYKDRQIKAEAQRLEEERQQEAYRRYIQNNHPEAGRSRYIGESQKDYWLNTLKHCEHCEAVINIKAVYCKFCREDLNQKPKKNKLLSFALGAVIGYKLFSSNKEK